MAQNNAHVLFSGGVDSLACAHFLLERNFNVRAIFIDYGQAARIPESRASDFLCQHLGIPLSRIDCSNRRRFSVGELTGRNMFLISAGLFLTPIDQGIIAMGLHAGTTYYDCSSDFCTAMARQISNQSDNRVNLIAPFLDWQKRDVYSYAIEHLLTVESSYSCEAGTEPPCGECASCHDRLILRDMREEG
jgi:7-cyano-7-deazaguanine synthase